MDALLSITGVSVRFGGGGALAGVGFQVPRGVVPVGRVRSVRSILPVPRATSRLAGRYGAVVARPRAGTWPWSILIRGWRDERIRAHAAI